MHISSQEIWGKLAKQNKYVKNGQLAMCMLIKMCCNVTYNLLSRKDSRKDSMDPDKFVSQDHYYNPFITR